MKKLDKKGQKNLTKRFAVPGSVVLDTIIKNGYQATEATAYFLENLTKSIHDGTKGAATLHCGRRIGTNVFKATKDFTRGDVVCGSLCSVSASCETVSGILIWIPFPGKIITITALKTVSVGYERIRDLCSMDPLNPLC